jgi:hypothetical protein
LKLAPQHTHILELSLPLSPSLSVSHTDFTLVPPTAVALKAASKASWRSWKKLLLGCWFCSVAVGWFPFGFHKASRGWAATSAARHCSSSRLLRASCLHLATHHHVGREFVLLHLKSSHCSGGLSVIFQQQEIVCVCGWKNWRFYFLFCISRDLYIPVVTWRLKNNGGEAREL